MDEPEPPEAPVVRYGHCDWTDEDGAPEPKLLPEFVAGRSDTEREDRTSNSRGRWGRFRRRGIAL